MPTQSEIEYLKNKHQRFTYQKLNWAIIIGLSSNVLTAPFEFIKVRAQLLGEGKATHGWANQRGNPAIRMVYEIADSGAGLRGLWKGVDSLIARSVFQSGAKTYLWCHIYDYYNKDPRKTRSNQVISFTNFLAGFGAGVISNPIDIVYNRQAADALFPKENRRNYSSFINGLVRANNEGVLMRGAVASGLSYGLLLASMSSFYDWFKEYMYFFFGPTDWLRATCLVPTALIGSYVYLPFDNIKTRLHVMTALPDGRMPYKGVYDALTKITTYESFIGKFTNLHAFHNGFASFYIKLYISLFVGIKLSDKAFNENYKEGEFVEKGNYFSRPYLKQIPHQPYNRSEVNKMILDIEPTKEFHVDESKTGSFKI